MIKKEDFKVTLINKEEIKNFVKNHGLAACVCYNTDEKYAEKVGLSVLKTGHFSGSRGDYFKFKFENVPRSLIDQSVRHEIGSFKNVQSQRYVNQENFDMYYPDIVANDDVLKGLYDEHKKETQDRYKQIINRLNELGYKGEKASEVARGISPMNIEGSFVQGFTLEAIMNYMNKRLCSCSQEHIRYVAKLMKEEIQSVTNVYDEFLVPICERNLWCPESKDRCCGRNLTRDELIKKNKLQ